MVLSLTEKKKKKKTRFAGWDLCVCWGWDGRSRDEFCVCMLKLNTIGPSFVNIPHKPETWKRYQGQTTNSEVICFKRIKLFSVPKEKEER